MGAVVHDQRGGRGEREGHHAGSLLSAAVVYTMQYTIPHDCNVIVCREVTCNVLCREVTCDVMCTEVTCDVMCREVMCWEVTCAVLCREVTCCDV